MLEISTYEAVKQLMGNSCSARRVLERLRGECGVRVREDVAFHSTTFGQMALLIG